VNDLRLWRDGPGAELLHEGEKVRHPPMFGNLAVVHSHDVHGFKVDFSAGWRYTQECSLVRSIIGLVSRHKLSIGDLPMNIRMEIRECRAKCVIKDPDAIFIRGSVGLGRVVNEVISEELFEDLEVPTALHFFGIAADDGFCGGG
jgi:hypothetical protein